MTQRPLLYSIILIVIAAISGALYYYTYQPSQPFHLSAANLPDSFADNVNVARYDATGTLASILTTPHVIHFSKDDSTEFLNPHIILYNKTEEPWLITAKQGRSENGFNLIHFQTNVKLHQDAGKNNNDITIMTSALSLDNKAQTAYTNQPVTMIEKANGTNDVIIIHSIGVYAEQKTGIIKLLSHLQGTLIPGKPNKNVSTSHDSTTTA